MATGPTPAEIAAAINAETGVTAVVDWPAIRTKLWRSEAFSRRRAISTGAIDDGDTATVTLIAQQIGGNDRTGIGDHAKPV